MYATIRRYEGIERVRAEEITRKATDILAPSISRLPGFASYVLIDSGEGVFTSVGLFETPDQAHASTRLAEAWIRDEDLVSALPRPPRTTMGLVIAKALKGETLTMGTPIHR